MNAPMIVWTSIIVLVVVAFVVRAAERLRQSNELESHRRLIEIGKETDMFYCPGDDYDDDED